MSCEDLIKALVAIGLMTEEDAQNLHQRLASTSGKGLEGADLAGKLVRAGKLTQFQANQVLAGKAKALVLGDYLLLDRIGAGGMGQVFQAQHRRMKRVVALKLLPTAALEDAAAVRRFQREVEAAAKLIHPNIVISYDAGQARGQHYLVMEYVNGKDLLYHLKEQGAFTVEQALDYILQAARGLAYAHSEGVVHRDIKPANLLLDAKGTIKILDMGLARIDDAAAAKGDGLTQTGQVMGTVDYMAPEQAFDTHKADARADVYSLGCTLYRLLTNENMFGGDSLVKKLIAHREGEIPSLRARRPDISQPLESAYQRMVAKQPEDRFQTMTEVIEALEACRSPTMVGAGSSSGLAALSGLKFTPRGPSEGKDTGSGAKLNSGIASQGTVGNLHSDVPTDPKNPGLKPPSAEDQGGGGQSGRRGLVIAGVAGLAVVLLFGVSLGVYLLSRGGGEQVVANDNPGEGTVTNPADNGSSDGSDAGSGSTDTAAEPVLRTTTAHVFDAPAVTPAAWHNLLEPVDVERDKLWGEWLAIVGQGLQANANASNTEAGATKSAMLVLPIAPQAEYQLRLKLNFVSGENRAVVLLPVGKRQVAFAVSPPDKAALRSGFEQVEGKRVNENETATSVIRPGAGETHTLDLIVLPRDPEVELYALWDGVPASHWKGTPDKIMATGNYALATEPAIGLVSENSLVRFESVELGLLSGDVRYRREDVPQLALNVQPEPEPMPMPMAPVPIAAAELTPAGIDLLKLVDPAKHTIGGTWTRDGAILLSSEAGQSGIYFPIYPPAGYSLEVVAERLAGNDAFSVALSTGATEFGVHLDGNAGTTCTISQVDGKGHSSDNPTQQKRSIFNEPGEVVRVRYEVTPGTVRVTTRGEPILEWQGELSRLSQEGYFAHAEARTLALFTFNSSYRIYEVRLLPVDAPDVVPSFDPALVSDALAAIQAEFKAEYDAAKKPELQATLARSLLDAAQSAAGDPIRQMVLWDEARRLATAGGDLDAALNALERRHARFPLDYLQEAATIVDSISYPSSRKDDNLALVESASDLLEQAIRADRYDMAARLGTAALSAARKTADRDRTRRISDRLAELKDIQDDFAKLGAAPATLKSQPDDPAANAALGRFLCYSKSNWREGLKLLVKGNDATAKAAAEKELQNPQAAAAQASLATQWWEIGNKLPRHQKKNALLHAAEWYLTSMDGLTPQQRTTALSRIDDGAKGTLPVAPALSQGLVAYWGFDQTHGRVAIDSVGKAHGLVTGGAKWTKGVSGGGLKFTGPGQYVAFPMVGKSGTCTIAMWVKLELIGTGVPLFVTQGNQNGALRFWTDEQLRIAGHVEGRVGTSVAMQANANKWTHVAMTVDDDVMITYVDGQESARANVGNRSAAMMPRIGPGRIGLWYDDNPGNYIRGIVDDVRVYSTALRPQDIAILVNTTAPRSRD